MDPSIEYEWWKSRDPDESFLVVILIVILLASPVGPGGGVFGMQDLWQDNTYVVCTKMNGTIVDMNMDPMPNFTVVVTDDEDGSTTIYTIFVDPEFYSSSNLGDSYEEEFCTIHARDEVRDLIEALLEEGILEVWG